MVAALRSCSLGPAESDTLAARVGGEMRDPVKAAAMIQLVAGLLNVLLMSWVSAAFWVGVGGVASVFVMAICTLGICPLPVGSACGAAGAFIALVGLVEILAGAVGLSRPEASRPMLQATAVIEILSVFLVNPVSVVAGVVVLAMLVAPKGDEAQAA